MTPAAPTLLDVYRARPHVYAALSPTPLRRHPLLDEAMGTAVWVKHEHLNPTGSFKVRGGLHLVASLDAAARARGVITASTGNHGQSMAFACRRHGVACTVVVPLGNNPEKNAAIRALGATLVEHGRDFDEAREHVEARARAEGLRYVHSADEPHLIAGVGTGALEIFEALPDADVVFVPIGGGSGASGLVTVRDGIGARARIVGVQAERADAFARSWRTGTRVTGDSADTFAEGLATRVSFDLPYGILRRGLADVVTLSEEALAGGMRLAARTTRSLTEGAGAAALAAAWLQRDALRGLTVVCVLSGGNLASRYLPLLSEPPARGG